MSEETKPRVMLVDDTPEDLYITNRLIAKYGGVTNVMQFNMATKALEALKVKLETNCDLPEIILLDIHMPQMTGFEFLEHYAQLPADFRTGCKVYVLSSSFDAKDIESANSNPDVACFCEKPLSMENINMIFSSWIAPAP